MFGVLAVGVTGKVPTDSLIARMSVVLGRVADARELFRQREGLGLLAMECRERELESGRHN